MDEAAGGDRGKLIGTRVKRSDSIFRMLLMASNRKKYGRMGAVRRKEIEQELRAKIEREIRERIRAAEPSIGCEGRGA